MDVTTQICIVCREDKSLSEYYKHPETANGRLGICKDCHRARMTLRRRTNPAVQAYDRLRAKTPERRAYIRRVADKWNATHPDGYVAHYKISNAVRDGRIQKQPCAVCGAEKVQAHHHDYSKPLDVVWLCPLHHHRGHADGTI